MEGWGEILAAIQTFGAGAWTATASWVTGLDGATMARLYWTGLSWATIYAAIAIFISSTDDAFLDLYFWVLQGQRVLTRPFRFVPTTKTIMEAPEKRLAIMVPAWQESDVIARMLMNTLTSLEYSNYDIFVGCYPNDPDTIAEVDRIARQNKQVVRAMVGHPGPTSKADCLNWMIQNIFAHEKKMGVHYDAFAMQDSEDVIHPLSFKVVNAYLDRSDMVQLPVLSMPRKWNELVPCHYMDEFAEWHGKDLIARSAMTRLVPSAGVATSFSRWCIELLCQERDNQPFNTDSLTEDYDVGHRLFQAGLKSEFVRFWAKVPVGEIKRKHGSGMRTIYRRELVGTREYFPDDLSVSVKQKSRWMLGISYLGWKQLGWIGPFSHRYFLYRDRKAIWTAPTGMLAYAIVFQWALYWAVTKLVPSVGTLPPLIDHNSWVWTLVLINFLFLVNRVVHRVIFTASAHGLKHAILSPVRMVVGNYVGFLASMRAARRFAVHMITGERITWDKTMHAYPSMAEISGQGNTLGDALKFYGIVNDDTLVAAEAEASAAGIGLATVLVRAGHATEEEIATAWSEVSRYPVAAFDPLLVEDEVRELVEAGLARKFGVFPLGQTKAGLNLAVAEPLDEAAEAELRAALKPAISFAIAPASDVAFGLRYGWDRSPLEADLRAARVLKRLDLATDEQIAAIWMGIRRVSAGSEAPYHFIKIARESGIVSDADWKILVDSQPELALDASAS
ncbi:glycosyl transferase family protein [Maricaulis sp.]|uniref:glycosyl transferase family protein n=1 Tax=Maricaulis sp. TaxID=1486257 RepID=UPI003A94DEA1